MSERKIHPKFNIHKTYKKMILINPYRDVPNKIISREEVRGYWGLDSNSNDLINGLNGIDTNIVYESVGVNNCAKFNGTTSSILVPNNELLSFTNDIVDSAFTISLRVRFSQTGNCWIISKRGLGTNPNTNDEYQLYIFSNKLNFGIRDEITNGFLRIAYSFVPTINTWYNIQVSYDGGANVNGIRLFINNTEITTEKYTTGSYSSMKKTSSNLVIGKASWESTAYFVKGHIDDVILLNNAINAEKREYIYNQGILGLPIL